MKIRPFHYIVVAFLLLAIILFSYAFSTLAISSLLGGGSNSSEWSINLIEEKLGLDIPADAQNIRYEGTVAGGPAMWGWTDLLHLVFMASPNDANMFVENICDGVLLQGFDPFRSEKVAFNDVSPDTIIIKMDFYTHNTRPVEEIPHAVYGNRCWGNQYQTYVHEIMVDKTNPSLYKVIFSRFGMNDEPRNNGTVIGTTPALKPIENSYIPIRILGAVREDDRYYVIAKEMCIEMYPEQAYPYGSAVKVSDPNPELVGADVFITIDGVAAPSGYIDDVQSLMPNTPKEPYIPTSRWNYCLENSWGEGRHEMAINVVTDGGQVYAYSWEFSIAR